MIPNTHQPSVSTTDSFYADLPLRQDFLEITNSHNFVCVPDDWYIVITDIRGSTKAIEAGRYKEVNMLGACSIIAVLNIAGSLEIPFVFGGDGATILIPPSLFQATRDALIATNRLANGEFQMELRVGAVPVADVHAHASMVKVAKFQVSEHYNQGVFIGGGLTQATDWVKDPAYADRYLFVDEGRPVTADFSGLECRWQDIPSQHGEMLSLLVLATGQDPMQERQVYRQVLEALCEIYGNDRNFRPVSRHNLHLTVNPRQLSYETRVRAKSSRWWDRWLYLAAIALGNAIAWVLVTFNLKFDGFRWGKLKATVAADTDYKKFDDILRMILSSTPQQRQQLEAYLEQQYQQKRLVYGIHVSDRALMTCLVFERKDRQVHFIDGADGGYALAAKAMKQRMQMQGMG